MAPAHFPLAPALIYTFSLPLRPSILSGAANFSCLNVRSNRTGASVRRNTDFARA